MCDCALPRIHSCDALPLHGLLPVQLERVALLAPFRVAPQASRMAISDTFWPRHGVARGVASASMVPTMASQIVGHQAVMHQVLFQANPGWTGMQSGQGSNGLACKATHLCLCRSR